MKDRYRKYRFQSAMATLLGGAFGHVISTGMAVIGGGLIGQQISLRLGTHGHIGACAPWRMLAFPIAVTAMGGILFLFFGISELFEML